MQPPPWLWQHVWSWRTKLWVLTLLPVAGCSRSPLGWPVGWSGQGSYCTSVQILRLHNLLGPWLPSRHARLAPGPAHGSLAQLRSCYPQAWPPGSPSLGVRLWATSPGAPLNSAHPAAHHAGPVHCPGFAFWHLGSNTLPLSQDQASEIRKVCLPSTAQDSKP